MQVGGDVGALGFAHALSLSLREILRGAQPQRHEREEHARHQGRPNETATQQDDGRIITRSDQHDAERQQHDAAKDNADKAQRSPAIRVAALTPHERNARDNRDDGPHVSPVQGARRVQDGTRDRRHDQGHADDDQAIARHLGGAFLTQPNEAGAERALPASLRGIFGDRHPQPQVDADAHAERGEADEQDAHDRGRQPQVDAQTRAHAAQPGGRNVRARGGRTHERGPAGRRRNRRSPPRSGGIYGSAHAPIVACHGVSPRDTPSTIRGHSGGPLLSRSPRSLVE